MEIKDDDHIAHSTSKEQKDDILSTQEIIESFLVTIKNTYPILFEHEKLLRKACEFADKAHKWQFRKVSWEPYLTHPLAVASKVRDYYNDIELVLAAILHDTVEDNDYIFIEDVYNIFGNEVWFLVDAVTDNTNYFYTKPKKTFSDKIEKLLYGWMQDIRCLLLKLADREHNLETIEWLKPAKQVRMSFETQAIYVPLKEILHRWEKTTTDLVKDLHRSFIKKEKINNEIEFKEKLYLTCFNELDDDIFNLVYLDTKSIIRKVSDENMMHDVVSQKWFDKKIDIIDITYWLKCSFSCTFICKQGDAFQNIWGKMSIQDSLYTNTIDYVW